MFAALSLFPGFILFAGLTLKEVRSEEVSFIWCWLRYDAWQIELESTNLQVAPGLSSLCSTICNTLKVTPIPHESILNLLTHTQSYTHTHTYTYIHIHTVVVANFDPKECAAPNPLCLLYELHSNKLPGSRVRLHFIFKIFPSKVIALLIYQILFCTRTSLRCNVPWADWRGFVDRVFDCTFRLSKMVFIHSYTHSHTHTLTHSHTHRLKNVSTRKLFFWVP